MPIFRFTSPEGKKYKITAPEGATQAQAFDVLQQQLKAIPSEDVIKQRQSKADKLLETGLPSADGGFEPTLQTKPKVEQSIGDIALGTGEAALALATGATGGVVGGIGGTLKGVAKEVIDGNFGTQAAAERIKQSSEQGAEALTYAPRTESGQDQLQATAEVLSAIPPVLPMAAPLSATARGSVLAFKHQTPFRTALQDVKGSKVAQYFEKGERQNRKVANEAVKQGFDESVVNTLLGSRKQDKSAVRSMVGILKHGINAKDGLFKAKHRPSQVAGQNMLVLRRGVLAEKAKAANAIEREAASLKNKFVDYSPAMDNFMEGLDKAGVKLFIGKRGNVEPRFKGSDFEGMKQAEKIIQVAVRRLDGDKPPTAYDVHRMKRFIDSQVSFGKKNQKALTGEAERIVKNLRHDLNAAIGREFDGYRVANKKYSEAITELDKFQKAVGTSIDLNSKSAPKAVGVSLRGLLSNNKSAAALADSIKGMERIAKESGRKIRGDTWTQILAADEIDRIFGAAARTSLKGQTEQAIKGAAGTVQGRGMGDIAVGAVAKAADLARGINEKNAIKALENLVRKDKK